MIYIEKNFDFNKEVEIGSDIYTSYLGKPLILREVYLYDGPITMQYLPYGGIQSVYHYHLILTTKSGFIATDKVIYNGKPLTSKEFIELFPNIVNEVLPC